MLVAYSDIGAYTGDNPSVTRSPPASPLWAETCACQDFDGTLMLSNLALIPRHVFSTISRQLATNALIHLIFPLCSFEGCPLTIKTDRSEERGGGETERAA